MDVFAHGIEPVFWGRAGSHQTALLLGVALGSTKGQEKCLREVVVFCHSKGVKEGIRVYLQYGALKVLALNISGYSTCGAL